MPTRVVACMFFVFFALVISAQETDTVHVISGIEIRADRVSSFSSGIKIEKIDSTALLVSQGSSIAVLLAGQSTVALRSYGPGGIATLTMRGTNSSQSGVFWNGINLGQPNMGQTDLSRIATFDFNDISLQSGGASALLGSGVLGGSLHLANRMDFATPTKTSVLLNGCSAGKLSGGFKLNSGSNKLAYVGTLSGSWNENNYRYTDFNGESKKLDHALTKSISSVHQAEYIVSPRQRLAAGFWYQSTDRLIPPTMTMAKSDQRLWDQAIRSSLQWSFLDAKQSFIIRSGFIDEKEHFESPIALIDDAYHLNTLLTEFEFKRLLGKQITLGSGVTGHIIRADIPFYNGIVYQPEGSVWLALAMNHLKTGIKSVLNMRQDFSLGYTIPFCPSFSTDIPIIKGIKVNFGVSRNYRVPTLNDKYGNPDLKPENSLNIEMGAVFHLPKSKNYESQISMSIYNLLIDNLIQWIPINSAIWKPQNIQKVWSRGLEISSKTDWEIFGIQGYFKFAYTFSPSTYRKTSPVEQGSLNKQLIYIPIHKVIEVFYLTKGTYYTMFSYSVTGKRYVQADNSKVLPAYTMIDITAGKTFKAKKIKFKLQAEVSNLFNTVYQSVLYYPEPGRAYSINLLISK